MANKLIVDWKEYNLIVEKLAVKIHESGFKPTMLIGIMRGGAQMSSTVHDMGGRLLLCDDLSDTGITLNKSIEWLKKYPPIKDNIESIKTAVLWKKLDSTFEPDYCADKLKDNPWIVQPFENYEEVTIEALVKKHKK
jgi:hypoxanthine phosphoribosyltransferase